MIYTPIIDKRSQPIASFTAGLVMPNILKTLLRSTLPSRPSRPSRSHHSQPLSPGAFSQDGDRGSSYSTEELTQLTADLARRLTSNDQGDEEQGRPRLKSRSNGKLRSKKSRGTFKDKMHAAVQAIQYSGQPDKVDPYPTASATSSQPLPRPQAVSIPSYIPPTHATTQAASGDEWSLAFQCCSAALSECSPGRKLMYSYCSASRQYQGTLKGDQEARRALCQSP